MPSDSTALARAYEAPPPAIASSHQTSTIRPRDRASPARRLRMELASVYLNRYTDKCGDSGRSDMRILEVDAAAVLLPVAVARGFRSRRTTDLDRRCGRATREGRLANAWQRGRRRRSRRGRV